ncbi:hypothetical protein DYB25_013864 [Aphanomyces astaci]|uniref:Uncharacterized protein n=1 Tax=Aphanomyces astaci TaxID=112090 RepID=A0A397FGC5_APHAT|nr:hypothetical protein DYB36_014058 [Aphanomyces astaci]RHY31199.1 hypothetical protein DYB25_013864 [Aphanomyces astaci]RHY41764.1 hypothetical protein DYB34_013992 [Aphanomyces astaci]RHY66086.1 hypothetical protein DYB38_013934 [Aphanomyces astaci]RHY77434.1 hypothetical protein DYB30_014028 [Aphanomyces astaci]
MKSVLGLLGATAAVASALPPCTKATLDGIKATYDELPTQITSACDAATPGFKLIDYFTGTGAVPTDAQVDLFTKAEACKVVYYDLTQIVGRVESCESYPGQPIAKQAGFPSLKELVAYRKDQEKTTPQSKIVAPTKDHDKAAFPTDSVASVPATPLAACTQVSLDSIKATFNELPQNIINACDATTPGFKLIDFVTTKGATVTDAQVDLFTKAEACSVVYFDLIQIIAHTTPNCNFYPGEPLAKQASFPSLVELTAYRRAQDKSSVATAVPQSTLIAPQRTIVPCDVSQIASVTSTIQALPVYSTCTNASGFALDDMIRRTNVYPTMPQLQNFASSPACQIMFADVQRILSQAPVCVFYDKTGVTFAELAKFSTLDTLMSFQMKQEGYTPTHTPSASASSEASTGSDASSTMQCIFVVAGIAAGLGVILAAVMYLRRKWAMSSSKSKTIDGDVTTTGSSANQSIFVINANAAL